MLHLRNHMLFSHAAEKQSLLKEKPPLSPTVSLLWCEKWGNLCKKKSIQFTVWQQNALNENEITHYALVVDMSNFLLSNIFLFHKNFTSMIMTNGNKPGGGHEMLARTINYCERRLPRCAPDQTPTTGAPPPRPHPLWPCASSLNNFSALLRWHLVAYFLSYPFISCHFFRGISSCSG